MFPHFVDVLARVEVYLRIRQFLFVLVLFLILSSNSIFFTFYLSIFKVSSPSLAVGTLGYCSKMAIFITNIHDAYMIFIDTSLFCSGMVEILICNAKTICLFIY